jgi:hypothetical protein
MGIEAWVTFISCRWADGPTLHYQIHLLITDLQFQSAEPFGFSQRVQSVINLVQWEAVFLCGIIQFPAVHIQAEVPALLPDKNDG